MIDFWEAIKTPFLADKKYKVGIEKGFHPIDRELYKSYNSFRPKGAKSIFCYLPYTSLTFSFGGQVFVCSYNRDIQLGKYPANTIDEIWNGPEAMKLREHMFYNDLDYGCRHCKFFIEKGKFSNLRPLVFDKYYKSTDAIYPQVFEFELSNECNLECQMCHGEVSSSIRKNRDKLPPYPNVYDEAFVDQLVKYLPHLKEAKFYGGEPFLIPIYYKIWDKVRELNPTLDLFVITNGSHWNSKIEKLVTELNFDIAISIDAFDKEKLERIRKNVVYEKLMDNIYRFSEICNRKGKHLSLSFTVQKDNWEQLPLIIELCNKVDAYIYISYLERPVHFALSDLNHHEWKKIRLYMNRFSFKADTYKEKHNSKCFEDFKHYLDHYINTDETKKYADYEFDRNVILSRSEEKKDTSPSTFKRVSGSGFMHWVDEQYKHNNNLEDIMQKKTFLDKINTTLSDFAENEGDVIRGFMVDSGLDHVIESIKNLSDAELKKRSIQSLNLFRNQQANAA